MNIDKILDEILESYFREVVDKSLAKHAETIVEFAERSKQERIRTVAAIHKAYKDAGYVSPDNAQKLKEMVNQMTNLANDAFHLPTIQYIKPNKALTKAQSLMPAAEWLDRFIFEYKHEKTYKQGFPHTDEALEAAKRAAGLSD